MQAVDDDDDDRGECGALWEHALTTFCSGASHFTILKRLSLDDVRSAAAPLHASTLCPAYSVFIQAHPFAQHCSSVAAVLSYVDHGLLVENLSAPPFFVMVRNAKRASVINV